MALDISTLFFMLGVTSALASLFVWFLRVTNPTVPGVMVVALSNTLLAAGYILISLRGVVPPFFSFLLANALLFLGFATFLSGLRRFFGLSCDPRLLLAGFAAYCLEFGYFYYVQNLYLVRLLVYLVTYGLIMAAAARLLVLGHRAQRSLACLVAACFITLSSVGFLTVAALALAGDGGTDVLATRTINVLVVLAQFLFVLGWTFAFTLMVSEKVHAEKVLADQALMRNAEALRRSNRDLEQFTYVISHDLQEPLRLVASYVQLLERKYKDRIDSDATAYINFAVGGVHRMKQMITDLLAYSRVEAPEAAAVAVDLNEVLARSLFNLKTAIDDSGAEIAAEPLPEVLGNSSQLVSLFQNLVGNAIHHRAPERKPVVRITARRDDAMWELSVADNGGGIDEAHRERVFEMFRRLHTGEHHKGTGIGLAICRRVVERHGGAIHAEAAPAGGAAFVFTLPAADASAA